MHSVECARSLPPQSAMDNSRAMHSHAACLPALQPSGPLYEVCGGFLRLEASHQTHPLQGTAIFALQLQVWFYCTIIIVLIPYGYCAGITI